MIGLLKKDFALAVNSKRTLIVFALIAVMLLFTGNEDTVTFAVTYFSIICGMMVLTTISYDDFDHGMSFLMTLPISRKLYVIEKYVFGTAALLTGWIISMLVSAGVLIGKGNEEDWLAWVAAGVGVLAVLFIMVVFMIPIQLKFGGDKGKMVIFSIVVVVIIAGYAATALLKKTGMDAAGAINHFFAGMQTVNPVIAVLGGIVVLALAVALSVQVSIAVITKREY